MTKKLRLGRIIHGQAEVSPDNNSFYELSL